MKKEEVKKLIAEEGNYKAFEYKGYKCRIMRRGQELVHLCGYVGLPKGHKYFEKDYDYIGVDVHGGLTYAGDSLMNQPETDLWWIGFDCAHGGDLSYLESSYQVESDEYRTMEYVENEIKKLVDQL